MKKFDEDQIRIQIVDWNKIDKHQIKWPDEFRNKLCRTRFIEYARAGRNNLTISI